MQFLKSNTQVFSHSSDTMRRIITLRCEHRELDQAIDEALNCIYIDHLDIQRMKKRKLKLKDLINQLENSIDLGAA